MRPPLLAFVILGLFNAASSFVSWSDAFYEQQATYLRPDEPHTQDAQTLLSMLYAHNQIQVYCQPPTALTMWNVFQSNRLRLQIAADGDYSQYKGATVREVHQALSLLDECHEGKPLGHSAEEPRIVSIATHDHACYGIYTVQPFVLTLEVISCDLERVTQFTFGLVLWLSCPLLADSLLAFYCSAAALGAHLAGVLAVAAALMSSDRERHLRLGTLKVNFKLVLKERPTAITLALIGGAWLLKSACQRFSFLWRRTLFRRLHHRLLRGTSYWLILTASDHRGFGWTCLMLLIPWPELLSLISWLNTQYARYQRCSFKPTEIQWEIVNQEAPYQRSYLPSGHDNLLSETEGNFNTINRHFYWEQRENEQEQNEDALICESCSNCHRHPFTWSCFNRNLQMTSTRNPTCPEPQLTTLYRNLHYSNSASSTTFK
ncbi:uncharacterized protein LOC122613318 [Drosophila teissieri]|uniref:uncharacterized protein LOC122613318 n=1 Tax=Drosophila teissieri TaxID=7243 RepID=UPI001CB9E88B|nr:uncharacterized protein LOC122613318 [Drosophila teissieri]